MGKKTRGLGKPVSFKTTPIVKIFDDKDDINEFSQSLKDSYHFMKAKGASSVFFVKTEYHDKLFYYLCQVTSKGGKFAVHLIVPKDTLHKDLITLNSKKICNLIIDSVQKKYDFLICET